MQDALIYSNVACRMLAQSSFECEAQYHACGEWHSLLGAGIAIKPAQWTRQHIHCMQWPLHHVTMIFVRREKGKSSARLLLEFEAPSIEIIRHLLDAGVAVLGVDCKAGAALAGVFLP